MKALLLSAGRGRRFRPLTEFLPKCLVPVNGYPLIHCWLAELANAGVKDIIINLYTHHELVKNVVESSQYRDLVSFSVEDKLLGTAGTLKQNAHLFADDPVLFIHTDNLSHYDFREFMDAYKICENKGILMMTYKTKTPQDCSVVESDLIGKLISYHRKEDNPPRDEADAQVYVLSPDVVNFCKQQEVFNFSTDVNPEFLDQTFTWKNIDFHQDLGTPYNYLDAQISYRANVPSHTEYDHWRLFWEAGECTNLVKMAAYLTELSELAGQARYWQILERWDETAFEKLIEEVPQAQCAVLIGLAPLTIRSDDLWRDYGVMTVIACREL
jgi:mannose-1-phosphate guanylyltransferase